MWSRGWAGTQQPVSPRKLHSPLCVSLTAAYEVTLEGSTVSSKDLLLTSPVGQESQSSRAACLTQGLAITLSIEGLMEVGSPCRTCLQQPWICARGPHGMAAAPQGQGVAG